MSFHVWAEIQWFLPQNVRANAVHRPSSQHTLR